MWVLAAMLLGLVACQQDTDPQATTTPNQPTPTPLAAPAPPSVVPTAPAPKPEPTLTRPAERLTLLDAAYGWMAFLRESRHPGSPESGRPYELWLMKEDGTSRHMVVKGSIVSVAGWVNPEELLYVASTEAVTASPGGFSGPAASLSRYHLVTRTHRPLFSFVTGSKAGELYFMPPVAQLAPDRTTLAYSDHQGVVLYDLVTNEQQRIARNRSDGCKPVGLPTGPYSMTVAPRWAPDGQSLLVHTLCYEGGVDNRIERNGEETGRIVGGGGFGYWSPVGDSIAYTGIGYGSEGDALWLASSKHVTQVVPLLFNAPESRETFARLFGATTPLDLSGVPLFGGAFPPFARPTWSRDGGTLAFCGRKERENIYTIERDGTQLKQLTDVQGEACSPFWSTDGTSLFYAANGSSKVQDNGIWLVRRDGTGHTRRYP